MSHLKFGLSILIAVSVAGLAWFFAGRGKRKGDDDDDDDDFCDSNRLQIITPDDIDVSLKDIGGMSEEIEEIKENIVVPLTYWYVHLFISCMHVYLYAIFILSLACFDYSGQLPRRWQRRNWQCPSCQQECCCMVDRVLARPC